MLAESACASVSDGASRGEVAPDTLATPNASNINDRLIRNNTGWPSRQQVCIVGPNKLRRNETDETTEINDASLKEYSVDGKLDKTCPERSHHVAWWVPAMEIAWYSTPFSDFFARESY